MRRLQKIGLIVNPMAGRDIRRLVAYASLQSQPEKALTARRIVAGIQAVPGVELLIPQDLGGFFAWLKDELSRDVSVELVPHPDILEDSTELWINMLVQAGADALIVVGGDGTQRNVAEVSPTVPVLPVAGGTNNVACYLGDQTAAGYAVARFLSDGIDREAAAQRAKLLHIDLPDNPEHVALIDVALTRQTFTGAMAIWDPDDVLALVLAQSDAVRPGLSNVAGYDHPISFEDDFGLFVSFGEGGTEVPSVLAPGLMAPFFIRESREIGFNQPIGLSREGQGATLALDGERTVILPAGQIACVTLRRDGPWTLDPTRIFAHLRGR